MTAIISPKTIYNAKQTTATVKNVKIFAVAALFAIMLAGCSAPMAPEAGATQAPEGEVQCHTVFDEVPVTEEVCSDVSFTESVCGIRKLNYSVESVPKVDLCISDGACLGKPLSDCPNCAKAMTRCMLRITNLEPQKTGTWSVGANYTLNNAGFDKDPITHSIPPGMTADFDFNQIYLLVPPVRSASCKLAVGPAGISG